MWKDKKELLALDANSKFKKFNPRDNWGTYKHSYFQWEDALNRSKKWYPGSQYRGNSGNSIKLKEKKQQNIYCVKRKKIFKYSDTCFTNE